MDKDTREIIAVIFLIAVLIGALIGIVFLLKSTGPWWKETTGKSALREAEWSKKIAIEEAKALKESAEYKKAAEIIRAQGIAEANEIIADSITEEYIRYKFIEGLNDGNTEVIYVPTEANLPILEARNK